MTVGLAVDNSDGTGHAGRPRILDPAMLSEPAGMELKPNDLFAYVWRRKFLVVAVSLLLSLIGLFAIIQIQPTYTARTTLMFDPRLAMAEGENVTDAMRYGAIIEGQLQVIYSRSLAERVIDDLGLMAVEEFNPPEGGAGLLAMLRGLIVGDQDDPEPVPAEVSERLRRDRTTDRVLSGLSAFQVGDSRVIALAYRTQDPSLAADIANAYAELYITQQLDARLEAMRTTSDWMAESLDEMRVEAEASERRLADQNAVLMDIGDRDPATIDTELQILSERITAMRSDVASRRAQFTQIRGLYQRQGALAAAAAIGSDVASDIRGQLAGLEQQRAELSSQLDVRHPSMVNITSQIQVLAGQLDQIVRATLDTLEIEVTTVENELIRLIADQEALLEIRRAVDQGEAQLRVMEREAEANRGMLQALIARVQENEAFALGEPQAYVISAAALPLISDGPGKATLMIAAMMGAVMAAVAIAIVLEVLSGTFNTVPEVERALGIRVLGVVPSVMRLGFRRRSLRRSAEKKGTPVSIALRGVLTAVEAMRGTRMPGLVTLVTSAQDGDGKTTVGLMLATMVASLGQRPVLVDADFERSGVSRAMGVTGSQGLSDVLAGHIVPERAIVPAGDKRDFAVVPAGRSDNQELRLGGGQMAELLRRLRLEYDVVIIDAPESSSRPDARLVAEHVDAQLLVVRWRRSRRRRARRAIGNLADAAPIGVVMTAMPQSKIN